MRTYLIMTGLVLLASACLAEDALSPAERMQRLRVEYEERRIMVTGMGYYERDMKRYMREVRNVDLISEMVRDCPEAVDLIYSVRGLRKKRWIPWFGQGAIVLGVFDTGKDGTFSSVLIAVSGISWVTTRLFDRKILKVMDRAVETYNQWLLLELGLGERGG